MDKRDWAFAYVPFSLGYDMATNKKNSPLNILITVVAFLGCFLLPLFILSQKNEDNGEQRETVNIESTHKVAGKKGGIRVVDSAALQPNKEEDFLLTAWFKLARLPKEGERFMLVGKFDNGTPAAGYAVALERKDKQNVAQVYWSNGKTRGRWYPFSVAKVLPKAWFMLALCFQDGNSLGLHFVTPNSSERVQLLGGQKLNFLPDSAADLKFGSQNLSPWKGELGPVGVFSAEKISTQFDELYTKMASLPGELPSELKGAVKFWTIDAKTDLSGAGFKIKRFASSAKKKVKKIHKKKKH